MAAGGSNFIRVRLYFEYPPPAVVDCRMFWMLVDMNRCRVVTDLESVIKEKFEFGSGAVLKLFMGECYLPHTESIFLLRDNDSISVKVDYLPHVNGHTDPDAATKKWKKRKRRTEEDEPEADGESVVPKKKKKKKKGVKESLEKDSKQASCDEKIKNSEGKKKKKKVDTDSTIAKTPPAKVNQPVKSKNKLPVAQAKKSNVSSSDSSSSGSEEDEVPKKSAAPKASSSRPAASKANPTSKPTLTKPPSSLPPTSTLPLKSKKKLPQVKIQNGLSSDSSSSSSEEDEAPVKTAAQKTTPKAPSSKPAASKAPSTTSTLLNKSNMKLPAKTQKGCSSDSSSSSEEEEAPKKPAPRKPSSTPPVPKKPMTTSTKPHMASSMASPVNKNPSVGQGTYKKFASSDSSSSSSEEEEEALKAKAVQKPPPKTPSSCSAVAQASPTIKPTPTKPHATLSSSLPSTATATSLLNGRENVPMDYSSMPLLAAPPPVGQKIAFKLLELTENYTPEVSDYKEGTIMSFDHNTKQIRVELHTAFQAPAEPGKFDLVYQNPDGSEMVEYAVCRSSQVVERWDSLLEPRLVL